MLEGLVPAFALVALSEFGDRSQLAAMLLGARFRKHHAAVFLGALCGFALLFFLSVIFASVVAEFVQLAHLKLVSAGAFVVMGLYIIMSNDSKEVSVKRGKGPFIASFSLVAFSELGDKTQLAVMVLAASMHDPAGVFLGSLAAVALLTFPAVYIGKHVAQKVPLKTIKTVSGIVFIAFGIAMLAGAL
ncbi:MAG: TMEM165/GDT1 family protein [Candidatus Aenigmarchaeota archaeon]|nr:TMEM165/GDT1 family protein [Candidatus Aenigmarchaeota archaeon]